tara:strand:- start:39 stop:572 length:534 start_codon:yes stop_codon:yes gene_type:complete
MQLIDNFYNEDEWIKVNALLNTMKFTPTCQPEDNTIDNRLKGYPCYETKKQPSLDFLKEILLGALKRNTMYNINNLDTSFRKIYTKELEKSPAISHSSIHKDTNIKMAGVVYFNGLTIKGGTSLYFNKNMSTQFEPDVIYAARPNRAVLYDSQIFHCANHDYAYDVRTIQTIFFDYA